MRVFIPLLGLLCSACVTMDEPPPPDPRPRKPPSYSAEMKTWKDCNISAAAFIATKEGDPAGLAVWASGLCRREEKALEERLDLIYRRSTLREKMLALKVEQLQANASTIIEKRIANRFPTMPPPNDAEQEDSRKTGEPGQKVSNLVSGLTADPETRAAPPPG